MKRAFASMMVPLFLLGCAAGSGRSDVIPTDERQGGLGPNMQDFMGVTEYLASSLVSCDAVAKAKTPPLVVIEPVLNMTNTVIQDMSNYTSKVRTILIQKGSNRVQFIDRAAMNQVSKEREFKERNDTNGKVREGMATADYFLRGELHEITNTYQENTYRGYRFVMRLTNADSGVIVWEDEKEIQKVETRGAANK